MWTAFFDLSMPGESRGRVYDCSELAESSFPYCNNRYRPIPKNRGPDPDAPGGPQGAHATLRVGPVQGSIRRMGTFARPTGWKPIPRPTLFVVPEGWHAIAVAVSPRFYENGLISPGGAAQMRNGLRFIVFLPQDSVLALVLVHSFG